MSYLLLTNCIGKDRGWKVNMFTVETWAKEIDTDAFNSTSTYGAVYAGLLANCKVKREEPDFTYEQVCDYVDELNTTEEGIKVLNEVKAKFEESQYYIKLVKKLNDQLDETADDKKKQEMTP